MIKRILLAILLISGLVSKAQYSNDPATFLKEVNKRLSASDRVKTKTFMEEFEPNWLTNFSSAYQDRVVQTMNLLEEKRRPAFPDIYGYLISAHSFVLTDQPKESFETWHSTIDALLNSKKVTQFQKFITVCEGFFSDGTIYDVPKYIWQVKGGEYTFQFEKNRPKITFTNVDLKCYMMDRSAGKKESPYFDSMIVKATDGVFEPFNNKWTGRGGDMDWGRTGLNPETNYAQITDYILSLKQTKLECDSVTVYTDYYPEPLYGDFKDMAKVYSRDIDRIYPSFTSFSKQVVRKNILPEVDYVGGFALSGADFSGVGYDKNPASLVFYQDGEPFAKASSLNFKVNSKGARASDCKVVLYPNKKDSIFHPGLNMNYSIQNEGKKVSMKLMRDDKGLAQAPFTDTYHTLDMYVDQIIWTKGDPNLNLTWHRSSPKKFAKFESQNYYSERVYNQIQGMNAKHPLVAIWDYAYKYDLEVIPINKISGAMGFTNDQAIPILLNLSNLGFITYSSSRKEITVQPKLKKYIDARSGKSDYDHIVFNCNLMPIEKKSPTTPDGREDKSAIAHNLRADSLNKRKEKVQNFGNYNIVSMDLSLNEVEPIQVSPTQKTVIFPSQGELIVKENLDFIFKGAVMSGKFEAYLEEGSFDYSKFRINLMDVDAALFRVRPIFGGEGLIPMYSHFENLKGYIAVDDTTNRSGQKRRRFHKYPILNVSEESYVFYDHDYVYNGVYDSADFYFKCDPFVFDSLDNFDEKVMEFDGELRSAGIFPTFKEKLRVQPDYSFGFVTQAPESGFDFYGDYANFDNEIKLSNEGLRGAGQIDFVTSSSTSENFVFFPDSTMGLSKYVNKGQTKDEGIEVPDVTGNGVMVTFVPKDEILKARAVKEPLKFFNGEAEMKGVTFLTKKEMTGRGLMYFKEAELGSKLFNYRRWGIDADTADFNLLAEGEQEKVEGVENPLDFNSTNLNAHVDFQERKGEFKSNDGTTVVEFPKNQYICFMDMFTWMMDNDEIELSKSGSDINIDAGGLDLAGSNFYSIHPEQDSLNFRAPKAKFLLKEHVIYCDDVEYLDVADARISPPEKKLTIRKKAKMDVLEGAEILANSVTKFHKITEANVQVEAAKKYKASGKYPYIDSKGEEQIIFFADIQPDTIFQTRAVGQVEEDKNFHLSDRFDFYGKVELAASEQFLTFDGATRINHDCDQFAKNWLKFRTQIDPNNIQIPVSTEMKDLNDNPIAVGLVRRNAGDMDSIGVYPAFLSALERPNDFVMFTSSGVLNYNEDAKEFRISSPEKLINRAEPGNYISLHIESCSMEGDGEVDLALNLPDVDFKSFGVVSYNAATKSTTMNVTGGLNFFMDRKIVDYAKDEISAAEGLGAIDFPRTTLKQAITEQVSKDEAENIETEYTINGPEGIKKLPKEFAPSPFYISNMRLEWNDRAGGFVSKPITAIVSIYGEPLFRDFTVRLAVEYAVEGGNIGTKMGYLIELPGTQEGVPGNYYFYGFERRKNNTIVQLTSSNKEMQAYISELKDDKKKEKKLSFELRTKTDKMIRFKGLFGE